MEHLGRCAKAVLHQSAIIAVKLLIHGTMKTKIMTISEQKVQMAKHISTSPR